MNTRKKDICFTDLRPEQQAAYRAARERHSAFATSTRTDAPRPPANRNSNVCIDDLTPEERAEWHDSVRKARI